MSQIPDDLKQRYEKLASYKPMELAVTEIYVRDWLVLIERIGSAEARLHEVATLCANVEAENARLRDALEKFRSIGNQMSNVMFNLKQGAVTFTERERIIFGELQTEWDIARAALTPQPGAGKDAE